MEPEVLPVFYYNDMLLCNIGDTIGLLAAMISIATALPPFLGQMLEWGVALDPHILNIFKS